MQLLLQTSQQQTCLLIPFKAIEASLLRASTLKAPRHRSCIKESSNSTAQCQLAQSPGKFGKLKLRFYAFLANRQPSPTRTKYWIQTWQLNDLWDL